MGKSGNYYRYVVISDLHFGSSDSNPKKIMKFLKSMSFDSLILNGDIIDGWKIKRGARIRNKEVDCLKYFLDVSKEKEVIYLRGNHDDFLDHALPINLGNIKISSQHEISIETKRFLVIHGDIFDLISKELKWISKLGDIGYTILIKLNKLINRYREFRGKKYYSFSKAIKNRVKKAVNYISDFENNLAKLSKSRGFNGIICGHIHHPEIKEIDGIMYYNSGDWVESMSALVYSDKNGWEIVYYTEKE